MRTTFTILLSSIALTGCLTTSQSPSALPPVADSEAARLAVLLSTELDRRARWEPAALDSVEADMRALEFALFPAPEPGPETIVEPVIPVVDMSAARSLFHAIHIASYRDLETALSGWETLSAMFPDVLEGTRPRVEAVDVPEQGHFLRLKAGPFLSAGDASRSCEAFRAANVWCAVTDYTGDDLIARADIAVPESGVDHAE